MGFCVPLNCADSIVSGAFNGLVTRYALEADWKPLLKDNGDSENFVTFTYPTQD